MFNQLLQVITSLFNQAVQGIQAMFNQLLQVITSLFNQAKGQTTNAAQTIENQVNQITNNTQVASEALAVNSLSTGQYGNIWKLLPGKPVGGSMIFLSASGMSHLSDFLNPNTRFTIGGSTQRNANAIEASLLKSLGDVAANELCNTLYLIYDYTLPQNPVAQVWAVLQTLNGNAVFVRSRGANNTGPFVFTKVTTI